MDDFSCAIFRADGDLVAQADSSRSQLGAMSLVVKAIIERWGGRADPGDAFLANHPYLGAMHTPDLNVIMPVFTGRKLFGGRHDGPPHRRRRRPPPAPRGRTWSRSMRRPAAPAGPVYRAGEQNPDLFDLVAAAVRDPGSTGVRPAGRQRPPA